MKGRKLGPSSDLVRGGVSAVEACHTGLRPVQNIVHKQSSFAGVHSYDGSERLRSIVRASRSIRGTTVGRQDHAELMLPVHSYVGGVGSSCAVGSAWVLNYFQIVKG